MPSAVRRSTGTDACVIVAGCEISDSTPPRLSASASSRTPFEQAARRLERAELERQHPAEAAHLAGRQRVLRVRGQARDSRRGGPWGASARKRASASPFSLCRAIRIGSVLVPRSTSHESNGLEDRPFRVLDESQPLDVVVPHGDDDAADAVAVAVEVFRRAVDDQIGAELDRALEARARERVVHDQARVVPVRQLGRGRADP